MEPDDVADPIISNTQIKNKLYVKDITILKTSTQN